jgi:adenosylcobyric acid synthase
MNKNSLNTEKKAKCLAVFGTGSDVGKSIVVAALCRFFADRGIRVAPFKAQNMSNNSGVTPEGLEMGRAQIVQAEAAGIPPHVDMNPILLKPTSDVGSQVVLLGEVLENNTALEYHRKKEHLFSAACAALDRLRAKYEIVIMEGAGSCAEVNLSAHDIVNFRMAEYADAPVILVADIHKGGVFAQIVGTLACLEPPRQERIAGCIINRFRGDIRLFEDGMSWIEQKTGKKVFGVLPWYNHIRIEAEDSVVIENPAKISFLHSGGPPSLAVIRIPHISNFTDFAPLSGIKELNVCFLEKVQPLSHFKAVILPGSKNTRFDLNWLKQTGWADEIKSYADKGGHILGICGGYQMLGHHVHDPEGLEGASGATEGLSLLPVNTVLRAPKTTTLTEFSWKNIQGTGYEIRMGQTERFAGNALFQVHKRNHQPCHDGEDGCATPDLRIMGTYIHGLFDTPGIAKHWLESIGMTHIAVSEKQGLAARNAEYDLLAAHLEQYVKMKDVSELVRGTGSEVRGQRCEVRGGAPNPEPRTINGCGVRGERCGVRGGAPNPEPRTPNLTFLLGGCRSGKSRHALELAEKISRYSRIFIATCLPADEEMKGRVANHQKERGSGWSTVEAPILLPQAILENSRNASVILADCLTLWVSNLLLDPNESQKIDEHIRRLIQSLETAECPVILVSNEVGAGIVPENKLARQFRDIVGHANQKVAASAGRVIWMVAGIPLDAKKF